MKMYNLICEECHGPFTAGTSNAKCCSPECRKIRQRIRQLKNNKRKHNDTRSDNT